MAGARIHQEPPHQKSENSALAGSILAKGPPFWYISNMPKKVRGFFRLVVSDIDGTLLTDTGRLSSGIVAAVQRTQADGIPVVLATARSHRSAGWVHRTLGLDTPLVIFNGAAIMSSDFSRPLFQRCLPGFIAKAVLAALWALDPDLNVGLETPERGYRHRKDARFAAIRQRFGGVPPTIVPLNRLLRERDPGISKLLFHLGSHDPTPYLDVLRQFGSQISVTRSSEDDLVEIMGPNVSKANAVAWILDQFDLDWATVAAIGDSPNDLALLQSAGLAGAVANAHPTVLAASDIVVPSNQDEGVACFLLRHVLVRCL